MKEALAQLKDKGVTVIDCDREAFRNWSNNALSTTDPAVRYAAVQEVTTRIAEVSGEARTTGEQAVKLRATSSKGWGRVSGMAGSALLPTCIAGVRCVSVSSKVMPSDQTSADGESAEVAVSGAS